MTLAQGRVGRWAELAELAELPDGRCLLSITTGSREWAAMALGSAGAEVSDVGPPELVTLLHDWSARFARATPPSGAPGSGDLGPTRPPARRPRATR